MTTAKALTTKRLLELAKAHSGDQGYHGHNPRRGEEDPDKHVSGNPNVLMDPITQQRLRTMERLMNPDRTVVGDKWKDQTNIDPRQLGITGQPPAKIPATPGQSGSSGVYRTNTGIKPELEAFLSRYDLVKRKKLGIVK